MRSQEIYLDFYGLVMRNFVSPNPDPLERLASRTFTLEIPARARAATRSHCERPDRS
jgi:hypothetical protein